jgi:hypothetical protein
LCDVDGVERSLSEGNLATVSSHMPPYSYRPSFHIRDDQQLASTTTYCTLNRTMLRCKTVCPQH